jgi:cullin 2
MFTDISLAEDLNTKFSDFLKSSNVDVGINYFVRVLQQGAWPLSQNNLSPLAIPVELEKTVQMYEAFYGKQFSGRKLTWLHHLSSGDIKLGYLPKTYIVNMTTFQMALLLLFEKSDSLNFKELHATTKMSEEQFPRYVQSLIDAKLLTSNTEELTSQSIISLNMKYSNKRTKFRIAGTVQRETPQEVEQTHHAIDDDRKMYLQAAIVRIMKSRKLLKHNQLIQEVLAQSKARFAPSIAMIKKCIESLIDKAYIERTPNTTDEYSYMA